MKRRAPLRLEPLEARETPSANRLFAVSQDVGNKVVVYAANGPSGSTFYSSRNFVTGQPQMIGVGSGRVLVTFDAYNAPFSGGVRLALGDVTGDGIEDLVTAPASGGGPHIKVFDGAAFLSRRVVLVREFSAFAPNFRGGTYLAIGQVDPATRAQEIIVSAGSGSSHVRVFSLNRAEPIRDFFAFDPNFRGGVRVASADMNGDHCAEIIAAAGPGGLPQVRVFDAATSQPRRIHEFVAYDRAFRGGVYVAAGQIDSRTRTPEIVTGAGEGGAPLVKVWSLSGGRMTASHEFFAGDANNRAGARVSVGNLNRLTDRQTIYVGYGSGPHGPNSTINSTDPRLHAFDLTQYITMMAAGSSAPQSLFGFTETELSLPDPFSQSRSGGLNLG
jgi:hypothetical protein